MKRLSLLLGLSLAAIASYAGSTVTDSNYVQMTRSGAPVPETCPAATPNCVKLECPVPKTKAECEACMDKMIDTESKRRTTGYVTYRCSDTAQSFVRFNKTTAPPAPTPVAAIQVYSCPLADADNRVLESDAVLWPNCPGATFKDPDRALAVAVNLGVKPMYWQRASELDDLTHVWSKDVESGNEAWVRAGNINWGTAVPNPPVVDPPTGGTGTVPLTWNWRDEAPSYTDGKPMVVSKYAIYFGNSVGALGDRVTKAPIEVPGSAIGYTFSGLPKGTWYFAVSSVDDKGKEGFISNFIAKTVQ